MKTWLLLITFGAITTQAQFAIRYLGPNTNGISEDFPSEVRERVPVGTIPPGFHTNITRAQLEALQARTFPAMASRLKSVQDTNEWARTELTAQLQIDLAAIESAVTNWRNLTTQDKDRLSLVRLRVEANRNILERGDQTIILERSRDTNSVPIRTR